MKIFNIIFLFLLSTITVLGQDSTYSFDLFNVKLEKSILTVWDKQNKIVFQDSFQNPYDEIADLDGDGINEYIIVDSQTKEGKTGYFIYVFNTIDSFYVADSINSGLLEPFITFSDELNGLMLVSGNFNFNSLNTENNYIYLPINCWKYENNRLIKINGEIYDFFISENDTLLNYLDSSLENEPKNCNSLKNLKSLIAAIYTNYLSAGEKNLANQFLRKYYFCDDVELFKQKIKLLL